MSGAEIQAEYSYVLTNGLKPNGMAKPVWRDKILRREQGQGEKHFLRSGDREVDPHSAESSDCTTLPSCLRSRRIIFSFIPPVPAYDLSSRCKFSTLPRAELQMLSSSLGATQAKSKVTIRSRFEPTNSGCATVQRCRSVICAWRTRFAFDTTGVKHDGRRLQSRREGPR